MMNIYQQIVNKKLHNITAEELMKYSAEYSINLTNDQAKKVSALLQSKKVNVFNTSERIQLMKEVAKITGHETAKKVNELFLEFTK
jgi:TRAP-type C4-dicarboxylate transport system substrate-binding protein